MGVSSGRIMIKRKYIIEPTTLMDKTNFMYAIMLFHGDGDESTSIVVTINDESTSLYGDEQAISVVSESTVSIYANGYGYTPNIEVLYLSW